MKHLPRSYQAAMALLLSSALLPAAAQPRDEGFGRWESPVTRCELRWPSHREQPSRNSPCVKLRVDQTIEGMLRVRFINGVGSSRYSSEELTFAGLLLRQDQPMSCSSGSCQPSWPLRLQVHGVATRRFDPRGLAEQLPKNQLAQGSCRLEPQQLECEASDRSGQRWEAVAQMNSQQQSTDLQTSR